MNILHFICEKDPDGLASRFLRDELEGSGNLMSCKVLTVSGYKGIDAADVDQDRLSARIWNFRKNEKKFQDIVMSADIDVVHIHSLSSYWGRMVFRWSQKLCLPVVVSTYKYFMEWNFSYRHTRKMFSLVGGMGRMLDKATAVHVVNEQEKSKMSSLSVFHEYKIGERLSEKTVCVSYAKTSDAEMGLPNVATRMCSLYRKAVDSNPFWMMTPDDRRIEANMLQLGAAVADAEKYGIVVSDDFAKLVDEAYNLSTERLRRIILHCSDQGVLHLFVLAMRSRQADYNTFDVAEVQRFVKPQKIEFLETTRAWIRVSRTKQMLESYPQYATEKKICIMLLNIRHLLNEEKLSLKNLYDFYNVLRFEDCDEFILENMLDEIGMQGFSARMFYIMHEKMNLSEGFVPVEMKNDRETGRILNKLFKSNVL